MKSAERGNLFAAWVWRLVFWSCYALAAVIGAAVPFVFLALVMKLEAWIGIPRWLDEQTVRMVNNIGYVAAFGAGIRSVYLFVRVAFRTFRTPRSTGQQGFLQTVELPTADTDVLAGLREHANEVTRRLRARPFDNLVLIPGPGMATSENRGRRTLYLGWLAMPFLTTDQLCAIIAHEAAHYDHHAQTYHGAIWHLNRTVSSLIEESEALYQAAAAKAEKGSSESAKQSVPLLRMSLGYSCGMIAILGSAFIRRLGPGNHVFEYRCDAVGAQNFGVDALASALLTVCALGLAFEEFCAAIENQPGVQLLPAFAPWFENWQRIPNSLSCFERRCLEAGGSHPSIFDRCLGIQSKAPAGLVWPELQSNPILHMREVLGPLAALDASLFESLRKDLDHRKEALAKAQSRLQSGHNEGAVILLRWLCKQMPASGQAHGLLALALARSAEKGARRYARVHEAFAECVRARQLGQDTGAVDEAAFCVAYGRFHTDDLYSSPPFRVVNANQPELEYALQAAHYLFPAKHGLLATLLLAGLSLHLNKTDSAETLSLDVLASDPYCAAAGTILAHCLGMRVAANRYVGSAVQKFRLWLDQTETSAEWPTNLKLSYDRLQAEIQKHLPWHLNARSVPGNMFRSWDEDYGFASARGSRYFSMLVERLVTTV